MGGLDPAGNRLHDQGMMSLVGKEGGGTYGGVSPGGPGSCPDM